MPEARESCVKPSRGPLSVAEIDRDDGGMPKNKEVLVTAQVGKPAPDFEATAYIGGKFDNVRLSDYKGQWVVLCFYPGDFTFV